MGVSGRFRTSSAHFYRGKGGEMEGWDTGWEGRMTSVSVRLVCTCSLPPEPRPELCLSALFSWECVSICACVCIRSDLSSSWACTEFLLPMPLNFCPLCSTLIPPSPHLSFQGPRCTPYLDKAAAGWVWCPDTGGWCGVRSSRLRHSQCCPRCPDEWRCGADTALCQAAGSAADHRLNSGSLPLRNLGSPDTGPDRLHSRSFEIWRADHVAALSKMKNLVL